MNAALQRPFTFEFTADEAKIAASRMALRQALGSDLTKRHLAPLAAFVLALTFAAILGLTELVSRRYAEMAILISAAAYLSHRILTRRRFAAAGRENADAIEALRTAGSVTISIDETGIGLKGGSISANWRFADVQDVEDAGGMIYLWPNTGQPAILPTRIFSDAETVADFLNLARAKAKILSRRDRAEFDDD